MVEITVNEWDRLSAQEQAEYIKLNDIIIGYTHDISDTLRLGFGNLDNNGFWEYDCKSY